MLAEIHNGTVSRQGREILSHFDFEIHGTEKIAVVGRNGAGKTTLLRVLAGEQELDGGASSGSLHFSRAVTVGMLRQQRLVHPDRTVEEECRLERGEAWDPWEYDRLFTGFGFSLEEKKKPMRAFSGGEQTKIALIRLLLSKPDILLLDEPTNHLDFSSVSWLEDYLRHYESAVVFVSHDRYFIDQTAEAVCEAEGGKLTRYPGNYTDYRREKTRRYRKACRVWQEQQDEIRREKELIERFKKKPNKAAFARSRRTMLERMERVEKPREEEACLHTGDLLPARPGSRCVFEAENLVIGYDHPLRKISFRLRRGQKLAVLGSNGAGKSTFLKTLAGRIRPLSGRLSMGSGIEAAWFDQQSAACSDTETVRDFFAQRFPSLTEREIREILAGYLFRGPDLAKRVCDLSGGEKSRLTLAVLLQPRPNLLLLDEPTSHMDIPARETMESLFRIYRGSIVFVSHDRYFIQQVADSLLLFEEDGEVRYCPFGYDRYREQRAGRHPDSERTAEEQAMIESLSSVPKKSQLPGEIPTEAAAREWEGRLLEENLEAAKTQMEEAVAALEQEEAWLDESAAEERKRQREEAEKRWTEACLAWYDWKYEE